MRKLWTICLMVALMTLLSSCQFSTYGTVFDKEDKLIATGDSYSFIGMVHNQDHLQFKRFSGVYTIQQFSEADSFIINIDMNISQGRFKCIIITDKDEIINLQEGDNFIPSNGSSMRLRVAGDDARGEVFYTIK